MRKSIGNNLKAYFYLISRFNKALPAILTAFAVMMYLGSAGKRTAGEITYTMMIIFSLALFAQLALYQMNVTLGVMAYRKTNFIATQIIKIMSSIGVVLIGALIIGMASLLRGNSFFSSIPLSLLLFNVITCILVASMGEFVGYFLQRFNGVGLVAAISILILAVIMIAVPLRAVAFSTIEGVFQGAINMTDKGTRYMLLMGVTSISAIVLSAVSWLAFQRKYSVK